MHVVLALVHYRRMGVGVPVDTAAAVLRLRNLLYFAVETKRPLLEQGPEGETQMTKTKTSTVEVVAHTPGPWWVRDNMLKEKGGVLEKLGRRVCPHCKKSHNNDEPVELNIYTPDWGVASLLSVNPQAEHAQHWANARLITAAPDLLATLKANTPDIPAADANCHHGICPQAECGYCSRIIAAHAVIAKAEGRQV